MTEKTPWQEIVEGHCLKAIAAKRLDQLQRAHDELSKEFSDECLHDLRVAARRMKVMVRLLRPELCRDAKRAAKTFRDAVRATSKARDADVLLAALVERLRAPSTDVERAAIEHEATRTRSRRDRLRRRALGRLERLSVPGIRADVLRGIDDAEERLGRHDAREFGELMHSVIEQSLQAALAPAPEVDDDAGAQQLHRMRLAFKKLRYALELVSPRLVDRATVDRVRDCQQLLGDHHDRYLFVRELERRAEKLAGSGRPTLASGLRAALHRALEDRRRSFRAVSDSLSPDERESIRRQVLGALPPAPA